MHERERWQVIKAMLKERSLVRIADVCRATGASEASVRRDFARLAEKGVATRVHGGLEAMPGSQTASATAGRWRPAPSRSADAQCRRQAGDRPGRGRALRGRRGDHHQWRHHDLRDGRIPARAPVEGADQFLSARRSADPHRQCRVALPGGEVYREQKTDRLAVRGGRDPALFGHAHVHERDLDRSARRHRGRSADRPRRNQAAQARRRSSSCSPITRNSLARQPRRLPAVAHRNA